MIKAVLFSFLSGALTVFAFAPFGLWPIALVSMVPLLLALDGARPWRAFFIGWVWGVAFFLGTVYWVVRSINMYGGVPVGAAVGLMLLLVFYLALFPALFAMVVRYFNGAEALARLFAVPAVWVAFEYVRGLSFMGFPWVLLGYSQVSFLPMVQVADMTGVWGVSFIVMLVNEAVVMAWRSRRAGAPLPLREAAIAASVVVFVVVYGFFRIHQVSAVTSIWETMKVGIAQGNIDQAHKWSEEYQKSTVDKYLHMTDALADAGAEFVVWPETAMPFFLEADKEFGPRVWEVPETRGVSLLTGSPAHGYNFGDGEYRYFNSAFLFTRDWEAPVRYDKVHLVPFGEYVPFKRFLPFVDKLTEGAIGDFAGGLGHYPLRFDGQAAGVLICYEAIFPEISRASVKLGATVLVNITNDSWFGKTSAPYQHLEIARLRAIENRVYMIRAANSGISAIVDPAGRVTIKSGLFKEDALLGTVGLNPGTTTLFTTLGPAFPILCVIVAMIPALNILVRRIEDVRRDKRGP